jgi:catechol 2,3-dioxygenase-like lactoylglutathione lyase family enzyme
MPATGFTHVSVHATDLEASARFYKDLFGMEYIPAPDFPSPTRWLRVGNLQLHLFHSEDPAPRVHHFALDVTDFEGVYAKATALGVVDSSGYFSKVYELPDRAAQTLRPAWPRRISAAASRIYGRVRLPGGAALITRRVSRSP